jgi:hypothetical protein
VGKTPGLVVVMEVARRGSRDRDVMSEEKWGNPSQGEGRRDGVLRQVRSTRPMCTVDSACK